MPSENECSEFLMNEMFRDKDIALVGNSSAMFGKQWPIDEHELVVRMNRAWDLNDEQKKSVGSRIDVLMASTEKRCIQAAAKKSSWVVWMTPKHRDELPTVSNMCYYPIQNWESLFNKIGARPSTGCMSCHLISRHIGGGCLTLYGFDFFSTPSWWIAPRKKEKKPRFIRLKQRLLLSLDTFYGRKTNKPESTDKPIPHDSVAEEYYIRNVLPPEKLKIILP